jgi:hypothetical protein
MAEILSFRRKLLLGATSWPAPVCVDLALAQSKPALGRVSRVGFLGPRRPISLDSDAYGGFVRGRRDLEYAEGNTLAIEWRFADGRVIE